ncbi:UDP-N-acetylglucosamine 4,6-dehydratase (inverting) [bacterium]|nr:UDP-N-acetylglucosamine 4,6-dehydratase (inverting) [bacterium]
MDIFQDKTILITGGTGSFGQNFVRLVLRKSSPKKVIVFSRDEFKQHHMASDFDDDRLRFFLGDIRDRDRLNRAFRDVDIVIHAAALKQVPALEYNPIEAVKTNVIGAQNIIEAALDAEVPRTLLVSTDKAAHPVNLYGATKLCAERLFTAGNSYARLKSKFSAVRYGNVVGSRGSIIERLLGDRNAAEVHITHPDMTRFWITLEQSYNLVAFAMAHMEGGEIFIPKIPSMKIPDLFDALAPNATKKIIGMRPGEKLHEVLLTEHESAHAIDLKSYFVIIPETLGFGNNDPYEKYRSKGTPAEKNFSFRSDTNDAWLTKEDILKMVSL